MASVNPVKTPPGNVEDVRRPLDLRQVARGYHAAREYCYWVPEADVEGTIPPSLRGTLFRNGPGLLEVYGKKLIHRKILNTAVMVVQVASHTT